MPSLRFHRAISFCADQTFALVWLLRGFPLFTVPAPCTRIVAQITLQSVDVSTSHLSEDIMTQVDLHVNPYCKIHFRLPYTVRVDCFALYEGDTMAEYESALVTRALDTLTTADERIATDVADVQRAWLLYAGNERNRTAPKLSRLTGIPIGKVRALIPVFQERWVRETETMQKVAGPYLESRVASLVDAMADRLEDIIRNGGDAAAVAAIREARSILSASGSNPTVVIDARTQTAISVGLESLDDVKRLVSGNVNQNVMDVDQSASSRMQRPRDRSNG